MKKRIIRLIGVNASNFKGIRDLEVSFGEINSVKADNGGNKSTIYACTRYGLGVNESNIKPFDKEGKVIYGLNPAVTLTFYKDGVIKKFSRSNVENWIKKKGQAESKLSGYKTLHFIDGVSVSQGEYNRVLKDFLEVDILKMMMEPLYFPSLDWKEQRKIALEIIGDVSDEMVIAKNEELIPLKDILKETTINDYLKVTKSKISKVKEEISTLPWRIEECRNSMEDVKDIGELRHRQAFIKGEILSLNKKREDILLRLREKNSLNERIYSLKEEKRELERKKVREMEAPIILKREKSIKLKRDIDDLEHRLAFNNRHILTLKDEYKLSSERIDIYTKKQEELRDTWREEESKEIVFTKEDKLCPLCLREFVGEDLEKAKEKAINLHEEVKEKRLAMISKEGKTIARYLERLGLELKEKEADIENMVEKIALINSEREEFLEEFMMLKEEIAEFKLEEPYLEEEKALDDKVEALEKKLNSLALPNDKKVKEKLSSLLNEEKEVEKLILKWEQNEKLKGRIVEIEERKRELEERQASLERREFLGEEFIRTKVSFLEEKINSKFALVSFKLFKEQINGGLSETCECTLDGVPYSSLNTASKINAGLDIINTLSNHYGLSAPVFIDNRESINNIINTDAQLINLIVSKDKELVINQEAPLKDEILEKVNICLNREEEDHGKMVEVESRKKREVDF